MATDAFHHLLFRYGWDTRCRNLDVARALKSFLPPERPLLDAGCGENGLADFIGAANVMSVDINQPPRRDKERKFIRASITSLPFANLSFPAAASVDVLEHLPSEARDKAIAELVRVARTAVVVAFPHGRQAEQIDKDFQNKLVKLKMPQPDWLVEHLQNPYPVVESVLLKIKSEAMKDHRQSNTKIYYSEHITVTQILRWTALRSKLLYIGSNLLAGLLSSLFPQPSENNSYRAVIVVEFQ